MMPPPGKSVKNLQDARAANANANANANAKAAFLDSLQAMVDTCEDKHEASKVMKKTVDGAIAMVRICNDIDPMSSLPLDTGRLKVAEDGHAACYDLGRTLQAVSFWTGYGRPLSEDGK